MKRAIIITLGVVLVLGALGIGYYVLLSLREEAEPMGPSTGFPTSGTVTNVETVARMPVQASNGASVEVHDFTKSGAVEDTANPGNFYLACSDPSCSATVAKDDFTIVYFGAEQSFVIGLTKEPLREAREHAERFFLTALGISETQACALNVFVSTDEGTNPFFAGESLGLSFCPGAVTLP